MQAQSVTKGDFVDDRIQSVHKYKLCSNSQPILLNSTLKEALIEMKEEREKNHKAVFAQLMVQYTNLRNNNERLSHVA